MTRSVLRLGVLAAIAAAGAGCVSTGARPAAFPGARGAASAAGSATTSTREVGAILETARALAGTPYLFGGTSPATGFDCSGLVRFVYQSHQIVLPRTTDAQFGVGARIDDDRVAAGDLIFFATTGPGPTHVGIALDATTMIHAPGAGAVVRVERFDTPYWATRRLGARRIVTN